jgi:hypothetical protein
VPFVNGDCWCEVVVSSLGREGQEGTIWLMPRKRRGPRDLSFDFVNHDPMDAYRPDLGVEIPEGVELRLVNEVVAMNNEAINAAAALPERADHLHRLWTWKALLTLAAELDARGSKRDPDAT